MILTYVDFIKTFDDTFTNEVFQKYVTDGYDKSQKSFEDIKGSGSSQDAYFLNFPIQKNKLSNFGDRRSIINCSYFNWDYSVKSPGRCSHHFKQIWDPNYFKCYKISPDDIERKNVRGFSAVIYLEVFWDNLWMNYDLDLQSTRAAGMQVLVHAPGTQPDMKLGMSIGIGMSTTIAIDQTNVAHLPDPYSHCTTQKTLGPLDEMTSYTTAYCVDTCLQHQYIKQCGCIVSSLQFTNSQLKAVNFSMCGNLSITSLNNGSYSFNWDRVNQILCSNTVVQNRIKCEKECLTPCQEYQYGASISASPWPHVYAQTSFYYTFIKGNPFFGTKYNEYDIVADNAHINKTAARNLLLKLNKDELLKSNFLQLNIEFKTQSYNVLKDIVAFPLDQLGAQVGGVLALWLGVTIILIFEVCEFVINVIYSSCQAKKPNKHTFPAVSVETKL